MSENKNAVQTAVDYANRSEFNGDSYKLQITLSNKETVIASVYPSGFLVNELNKPIFFQPQNIMYVEVLWD